MHSWSSAQYSAVTWNGNCYYVTHNSALIQTNIYIYIFTKRAGVYIRFLVFEFLALGRWELICCMEVCIDYLIRIRHFVGARRVLRAWCLNGDFTWLWNVKDVAKGSLNHSTLYSSVFYIIIQPGRADYKAPFLSWTIDSTRRGDEVLNRAWMILSLEIRAKAFLLQL